ncbi:hypothetical protein Csp2054_09210 [Curtobacterium sp. 'Ferrero']|nr:hypothetical protein Csp2054_09210 [Curtobacterium sp. 'Ferrero']
MLVDEAARGLSMAQSKHQGQAGVKPAKIATFRSVRRRVRRGDFEDLAASVPDPRTAVERWDFDLGRW